MPAHLVELLSTSLIKDPGRVVMREHGDYLGCRTSGCSTEASYKSYWSVDGGEVQLYLCTSHRDEFKRLYPQSEHDPIECMFNYDQVS
jgi:hypothetical protein